MTRGLLITLLVLIATLPCAATDVHTWRAKATDVALVEDHRAPLVHVVIELPVGSTSAWARRTHAEEAFEIQLFDPAGDIRRRADLAGIDLRLAMGATTSRLELTAHRDQLSVCADLIRLLVGNRSFDLKQLERWQKARVLTWEGSQRNPHMVLARAGARLLFTDRDSRRLPWEKPAPVLDDHRQLLATRDRMLRLPGRRLGLAGDLDRSTAEAFAGGLLPPASGTVPADLEPVRQPLVPTRQRRDTVLDIPHTTQVFFAWTRPSPSDTDADWPAFLVADHVLGGHIFSRLYEALRHQAGHTYGARTVNRGGEHAGPYALTTATAIASAAEAEAVLRRTLADFHRHGIAEAERMAAVGFLEGRRLLELQTPRQRLDEVLEELRRNLPRGYRDRLIERAEATSLEDVNRFITRFYDPAQFTMLKTTSK